MTACTQNEEIAAAVASVDDADTDVARLQRVFAHDIDVMALGAEARAAALDTHRRHGTRRPSSVDLVRVARVGILPRPWCMSRPHWGVYTAFTFYHTTLDNRPEAIASAPCTLQWEGCRYPTDATYALGRTTLDCEQIATAIDHIILPFWYSLLLSSFAVTAHLLCLHLLTD